MADGKSKKAGTADPELTYQLGTALFAGDVLTGTLSRTAGESGGAYTIELGSLSGAPNYRLEYTPASFVIEPSNTPVLTPDAHTPAEFRYAGGLLWFHNIRGNVQVYNAQARLVGAFQAHADGSVALPLPTGRYWVRAAAQLYTFRVE